jgi:hypothetical protein
MAGVRQAQSDKNTQCPSVYYFHGVYNVSSNFEEVKLAMNSLAKFSFIFLLIIMPFAGFTSQQFSEQLFPTQVLELNNKLYKLEIADTVERKTQGLMFRQNLQQNAGMLFVYSNPGNYRIWMKNTLIPLTVIWLDEQAQIIDKKILQPCRSENCPVFGVSRPSKFIIELHPSEFNRFNKGGFLPAIIQ